MGTNSYHRIYARQDDEENDFAMAFVAYDLSMSRQLQELERRWAAPRAIVSKYAQAACLKSGGVSRRSIDR